MLSTLEQNPSLAFQTPPSSAASKTPTQEAIERAVIALAQRAGPPHTLPVSPTSSARLAPVNAIVITPTRTPPPLDTHTVVCPSCSAPLYQAAATPTSPFASLDLSSPRQTPWSNGNAGETGMSAEKELELLKAQVQDIARVCKVRKLAVSSAG